VGCAGIGAAAAVAAGPAAGVAKRQLIDGIRWRVRTGAPWRDVPSRYGPWQTVYGLFRRWQRDGTWAWIVTRLQAAADAEGLIYPSAVPRTRAAISSAASRSKPGECARGR